ncbi:MAG: hypothetical protein M1423_06930, partial [Acidobacteria bacterium]|nr:hypothetical protein [Acidobacteriota bacterium]
NVAARYFEAGKWWLNDPDALVGNNRPVEEYRAWNTLAAMSGSVITIGDDLSMLAREKWGILERILPAEGRVGTPVDLFQSAPNNIWFLPTNLPGSKSGVLSLFNWGSKVAITHKINLATVLNTKGKVLAYDFWNDCLLAEKNDDLEVSVPPRNVRTFCLVEAENRPQVLDVSNFLPQTGWGLDKVKWSAATKVLQGETEGLSGKMYHIVFYSPKTYAPIEATVNGRRILLVKQRESVWVIPITGSNHPEEWSVKFQSK